jgi:hypothetical protein
VQADASTEAGDAVEADKEAESDEEGMAAQRPGSWNFVSSDQVVRESMLLVLTRVTEITDATQRGGIIRRPGKSA